MPVNTFLKRILVKIFFLTKDLKIIILFNWVVKGFTP
nr:MAG TPA: hypothetical protein [Caudoviricetes sp.]